MPKFANLVYDPLTGKFWRGDKVAGTVHSAGYVQITVNRKLYLAHRLAWFVMTSEWPEKDIDHRNMDKQDNRFSNLRLATDVQNQRNRCKPKNNTSGYKGVSWNSGRRAWQVTIRYNGTNKNLGYYPTREQAADMYNSAALKYHGEFARIDL